MKNQKAFTIIELVVVIAIIAVLSTVVMAGVTQYITKGKDANVKGNLAVLIPAGEVYYNIHPNEGYDGFCTSPSFTNAISQMPENEISSCYNETNNKSGVCCTEDSNGDSWAACADMFTDTTKAFCVDSRGVKTEMCKTSCDTALITCPEDETVCGQQ